MIDDSDRNAITTSLSAPSTPRLRLRRSGNATGLLDGGWWPRSANPVAELPGLILALDHLHGPVIRIVLHRGDWAPEPRRLGVEGRVVPVTYFTSHPSGSLAAFTGAADVHRIDLLVVPAEIMFDRADAAMSLAAERGNHLRAQQILDLCAGSAD
ncbi:DUF5994 family protein [Microlunatus parietis]|uniref:Uncharacterized protein n=1 Tax=Microlunatus parietis TaxID=682979 RepID=A0A7Y9I899_9ACTN|nr:DUF5994 family protein [Microlunatus parietis]NYE71569.1 hypothetical protein [Microlunatus parietis]